MHTATDDLARTRHAFERWRANRRARTRIPQELWEKAVALLSNHPITRVARELRLDPAELKKRRHAPALPLPRDTSASPQFFALDAAELNRRNGSGPLIELTPTSRQLTHNNLRLQIERADGHRLTLSVPSSEWKQVETLCSLFLRA